VRPAEVDTLTPVLDRISKGEVTPPERKVAQARQAVSKVELVERVAQATELLRQVAKAKAGERVALVAQALAVLDPPAEEAAAE
jgi:hypothetical protein